MAAGLTHEDGSFGHAPTVGAATDTPGPPTRVVPVWLSPGLCQGRRVRWRPTRVRFFGSVAV